MSDSFDAASTQHAQPSNANVSLRSWLRPGDPVVLGEVIGEGGMGVVRSAVQPSLQRVVAVKAAKPGSSSDDALSMLREAWVTGFLEHPSIVPVHEIALATDGSPLIVMRRIHGSSWHDCMGDRARATSAGARDLLDYNLRIFVQVCHALVFAHEKGVIHRDIKPGNVMLGAFGEVYVLDWGIALALFGPAAQHLPLASDTKDPAGTIAYMAPEMAGLVDAPLSVRTDVYLLGAVLFEIATGRPPHDNDLNAALVSLQSPPSFPAQVSSGLASLCGKAMQVDPAQRYATVAELRDDVQRFLIHRDSLYVVGEARALLQRLRDAIVAGADRRTLYDIWGECRYAFREALRTWPENEAAQRGLREAATMLAEDELTRDPRVAAAILDDVADAPASLHSRVHEAIDADDRVRAGNAQVARALDPSIGWRTRNGVLVLFGVLWTLSALFGESIGPFTNARFAVGAMLPAPLLAALWFGNPDLRRTLFNRRSLAALTYLCAVQTGTYLACWGLHVEVSASRTLALGVGLVIATMAAITVDTRLWPMTGGLAVAFATSTLVPSWRLGERPRLPRSDDQLPRCVARPRARASRGAEPHQTPRVDPCSPARSASKAVELVVLHAACVDRVRRVAARFGVRTGGGKVAHDDSVMPRQLARYR